MSTSKTIQEENKLWQTESFFWMPDYLEPSAWIEHVPFSFWLIANFKPNSLIELGVYNGTSYFSFCQAIERLNLNTKAYGIDTWKGDEHAGFYNDDIFERVSFYNVNNYSRFSTLIRSSFDNAREYFTEKSIDLLHIDGLHTYEAVKHDFETWLPVLSENAIVIFHDINVRERKFGVFQFWEELKLQYPHFEFDFGFGLGVITLGNNHVPVLQALFKENKSATNYSFLRNLFAERGYFFKKTLNFLLLKKEMEELKKQVADSTEKTKQVKQKNFQLQKDASRQQALIDEWEKQLTVDNERRDRHAEKNQELFTELKDYLSGITENNLLRKKNTRLQVYTERQRDIIQSLEKQLEQAKDILEKIKETRAKDELVMRQLEFGNEWMQQQLHQSGGMNEIYDMSFGTQNPNSQLESDYFQQPTLNTEKIPGGHEVLIKKEGDIYSGYDEGLNKELHLPDKDKTSMQPTITEQDRQTDRVNTGSAKILDRFPIFPFFIKKNLLLIKWSLQGSRKKYEYRIDFWNNHRNVPYGLIDQYIEIQNSGLFDKDWYLSKYEDVKNNNVDPILHYLLLGFSEGRDTGPSFSTKKYLHHYSDVRKAGVNALLHYLHHGKKEGRIAFHLEREEEAFPYPGFSHIAETSTTTPTNESMHNNESDFLKRNFQREPKRSVTAVKTVAFIAQPEYFSFHYTDILEDMYTVRYFSNSFSEDPAFFKELIEFDADINIFFRGEIVPQQVLESLTGVRVGLSSEPFPKIIDRSLIYTEDSLNRFEFFLRIFDRSFDYIFHYDEVSKFFFENQGIEVSGYFPFPIATEKIEPAMTAKKWDIFFSGRSTDHRDKYFGPLKRDFNFLHINHGVVGSDLLDFVHMSKISLNIHAENEISWEPRTQFLMAAGALLVSEPLSPTCPLRPGVDFVEVRDPWNAYETCRDILKNYSAYRHIAENGRRRIETLLSSRKTFPVFFNDLLIGKYKAPTFNKNCLKLEPLKTNLKYNGFEHLLTEFLHEHA